MAHIVMRTKVANKRTPYKGVFAMFARTPQNNVRRCSLFAEMFAYLTAKRCFPIPFVN
jgi:hypothetical protein